MNMMLSRLFWGAFLVSASCVGGLEAEPSGTNLALGKRYTLSPEPDYTLTVSAADSRKLTDGKRAEDGAFHVQPERTVGWGVGQVRIVVDLEEIQPIKTVHFSTVTQQNVEMPLPWLTVAASDDGDRYHLVGHSNGLASPRVDKPGEVRRILEVTGLQTRARHVALLVRTSGWYIFGD